MQQLRGRTAGRVYQRHLDGRSGQLQGHTCSLWPAQACWSRHKAPLTTAYASSRSADTTSDIVRSASTDSIQLYYRTGWGSARVHGSLGGGTWQDYPLKKVTSAPGKWLAATIPVKSSTGNGAAALIEFVINDYGNNWDKPPEGGNYTITGPGTYTLRRGTLVALPPGPPPVMIVSDLDGTMVGDDVATTAFKEWWENEGVLRGGLLVYNTGRALDSFERLLTEKAHCLGHPDILISAVGTKIYNFTPDGVWKEDQGWMRQLDLDWKVGAVREAAYAALAKVGKEVMHFRPPEEQNDHKVTCGVNVSVLAQVLHQLDAALLAAAVKANVITSGTGGCRQDGYSSFERMHAH
eukprot:GHRR01009540.1.p1 GENE.GHRR01009540.1~~GHRR01009540.1.p1  ORF type:complete len:351 (+),score=105.97 GHRR01009540.1:250-1302(+)